MECCCYLRRTCTTKRPMARQHTRNNGASCDGLLIRLGATISYKTSLACISLEKKRCFLKCLCRTCGWRMVTCPSRTAKTLKTRQPPKFTSKGSNSQRSLTRRNAVVPMCGRISQTLRSSTTSPWRMVRRKPRPRRKEGEETFFDEEQGTYFWSMSADFVNRHHEVH